MKSKIAFLVVGIALGVFLTRFFDRTPSPHNDDTPIAHEEYKRLPLKQGATIIATRPLEQPVKPAPTTSEKTRIVRIEESTVRQLEEEKELLRQHAFADRRDDGWQIHILEQDQALLQAGLSDGEIITNESLDSQIRMTDRSVLVTRFVALLKYIER